MRRKRDQDTKPWSSPGRGPIELRTRTITSLIALVRALRDRVKRAFDFYRRSVRALVLSNPSDSATWSPITLGELSDLVTTSLAVMQARDRRLWDLVRVPPVKWCQHPWGDLGGGFWVVGLIGRQVLWYNDIEDGFNVSRYDEVGTITEYWSNQDELHHVIIRLNQQIDAKTPLGNLGPPGTAGLTHQAGA